MTHTSQRLLAALGAVAVLAIGTAGCSSDSESPSANAASSPSGASSTGTPPASAVAGSGSAPQDDVKVVTCGKNITTGIPQAKVRIENGTNAVANYLFNVVFVGKDGTKYGTQPPAPQFENGIQPGRGATVAVVGGMKINGPFTCEVVDLTRKP